MLTQNAAIAANRFGLGARPRDAAAIGSDPKGWLEDQLAAAKRATAKQPSPPESAQTLQKLRDLQAVRQAAAQARANAGQPKKTNTAPANGDGASTAAPNGAPGIAEQAIREFGQFSRDHYMEQVNERNRRAIETDQPFVERLVQFWANHFAISADKALVGPIAGLYEQEAIRPHAVGNFYALLLAVERHPAMNMYLDNTTSMGPSSTAAGLARSRGRTLGLNENLAREILELHTLGVDGGYTQQDVTEFAKVITGWSIGGAIGPGARGAVKPANGKRGGARGAGPAGAFASGGEPGQFYFRAAMHEPGEKTVLGKKYKERGVEEGEQVLATLARSAATAKHLATKLARHFVADDPPAALVARLADVYLKHDGELAPVYRELIRADESWREPLAKYKTPNDFVISTFRALDHVPDNLQQVTAFLNELGQRPYTPGSPAGWPDTAANWDGGDSLLKRIQWSGAVGKRVGALAGQTDAADLAASILGPVSEATLAGIRGAADRGEGLALLISAPEFQRR
ncbi:MAG TPA: DUF1800 domain-containing protein [Gammaproteobacteria bacterium]|nr:DUF1800 domain-containing protein [Gammaproteobacteria bacterium]